MLARLKGARPVYGALVDTATYPATVLGLVGPLPHAASRQRFLAGALPTDPTRAAWAQRQHWAFPLVALRAAPSQTNDADAPATTTPPIPPTATYRQESVRCGKPACRRCRTGQGQGQGHGPYWYAYWHQDGRLYKHYLGATFVPPATTRAAAPTPASPR